MTSAKFKLNWKVKAHTFRVLDNIPFGENLYYLLQRYVTKSIPRQLSPTKDRAAAQISHALKFRALGVDLAKANLLEFGAGWDLYSNLILYCMGVDRQCTIDVRRLVNSLVKMSRFNHAALQEMATIRASVSASDAAMITKAIGRVGRGAFTLGLSQNRA
jgi:hypothetical protein